MNRDHFRPALYIAGRRSEVSAWDRTRYAWARLINRDGGPAIRLTTGNRAQDRNPAQRPHMPATARERAGVSRCERLRLEAKAEQCSGYSGLTGNLGKASIERVAIVVEHVQDANVIFEAHPMWCVQRCVPVRVNRAGQVVAFEIEAFGHVRHGASLPEIRSEAHL